MKSTTIKYNAEHYNTFAGAPKPHPRKVFQSPLLIQDKFGYSITQDCEEMQRVARQLNNFWSKLPEKDNVLQEESKSAFGDEMITSLNSLCEAIDGYVLSENTDEIHKKLISFKEKIDLLNDKSRALKVTEDHARKMVTAGSVFWGGLAGSFLGGFGIFCGAGIGGFLGAKNCGVPHNTPSARELIWLQKGVEVGEKIIATIEAQLPKRKEQNAAAVLPAEFF